MNRIHLVLITLALGAAAHADEASWRLHYETPAEQWVEALPIGNGRIGAMVFGEVPEERLQVNHQDVWTGGPHQYAHEGAHEHLDEIRGLLFAGEQKEAEELASRAFMSRPLRQQKYQPLADLRLRFDHGDAKISEYRRELDLNNALSTTTYTADGVRYERTAFASHPDRAIIVHCKCDKPGGLSFRIALDSPHEGTDTQALTERTLQLTGRVQARGRSRDHEPENGVRFASIVFVTGVDGELETLSDDSVEYLQVTGASQATLILTADTNVKSYQDLSADPSANARRDALAAFKRSYQDLLERHVDDHRGLFDRVEFTLADDQLDNHRGLATDERLLRSKQTPDPDLAALVFHYGRYLMIASSRPGGQPANLQGLWNQDLDPAWGSKYTTNINAEMNYWLAEPCGLGECHEPLFDAIEEIAETGSVVAKEHYDAAGWVLHHNFDRWRGAAPINASNHGIWPTGGAWLCQHLWLHYEHTGDQEFLRDRAYPLMKGAAEFFVDYLIEDPREGRDWLISGPSNSPENGGLVMGPTMDHQIIRDLFSNTIKSAEVLGVDEELRQKLAGLRSRVAPNQVGSLGQLQEWLEDKDDPNNRHRHVSHLWGLHPGCEITPDTPKLFSAVRKSLEMRGDGGTGWSRAWKVNFWARLRDGDHTLEVLDGLMTLTGSPKTNYNGGGLYPNLFDAHPPFQIDGNFGATAGICEMLVQSHRTTESGERLIEFLPALPSEWPDGEVRGLRTRGGLKVSLVWREGTLVRAEVESLLGEPAMFAYDKSLVSHTVPAGEQVVLNGQLEPVKQSATNAQASRP